MQALWFAGLPFGALCPISVPACKARFPRQLYRHNENPHLAKALSCLTLAFLLCSLLVHHEQKCSKTISKSTF